METASVIPDCAPSAIAVPRAAPLRLKNAKMTEIVNIKLKIQLMTMYMPPLGVFYALKQRK